MSTLITTTAQIGTIKDAGGNATGMTISSSGEVGQPQMTISMFGTSSNTSINTGTAVIENWTSLNNSMSFKDVGSPVTTTGTIFTFPSTGIYEMHLIVGFYGTNDLRNMGASIDVSPAGDFSDGDSHWAYSQLENFGGTGYAAVNIPLFTNVTNTNFRVRCRRDNPSAATLRDKYYSKLLFRKIAPAQS